MFNPAAFNYILMAEQGTPFSILCSAYLLAVESANLAVRLDKASHCHQQMVGYGRVNGKRERERKVNVP